MTNHELTDPTGSALTINHAVDGVWVTATDARYAVAVGPFPAHNLRDTLLEQAGSYTRTESPDLMDGGVTCAAIEAEALSGAGLAAHFRDKRDMAERRAEKAEQERDESLADVKIIQSIAEGHFKRAKTAEEALDEARRWLRETEERMDALRAEQHRPLTADDITDRFLDDMHEDYFWSTEDRVRLDKPALRHALLDAVKRSQEPPRPEGAEELDDIIDRSIRGCSDITSPETVRSIANALAEEGIRVPGADQ